MSEPFSRFESEIAKYDQAIHVLNPGASEDDLRSVEATLGVVLPPSYREFLLRHNGASLFKDAIVLYRTPGGPQPGAIDLLRANQRKWPGMPAECVTIGSYNFGDELCILKVDNQGIESGMAQWDHEIGRFGKTWPTLEALLDDIMLLGSKAFRYDGSHRHFVFPSLVSVLRRILRRK